MQYITDIHYSDAI